MKGPHTELHARRAGLHRAAVVLVPVEGRLVRVQRTVRIEKGRSSHGSITLYGVKRQVVFDSVAQLWRPAEGGAA